MEPAAPVVLDDLTRNYGEVIGVDRLCLSLLPGEVFGLVGLNGAGKSTTLRLVVGLLAPTRGRAYLYGQPARSAIAGRRRLGYLPSEVSFHRSWSGRRNLDLLARLSGRTSADVEHRRAELGLRLGLSPADLARTVAEMSHGMRQKVGLLQALQHDPDLVVLDEPSDGLDPMARDELTRLIGEHRTRGGTVLLASHVLGEIDQVADRVGVLHRGRLVLVESMAALRRREGHVVEVDFGGPVPPLLGFESMIVERGPSRVVLRAQPPLDRLIKALAQGQVDRMTVRHARLDEVVRTLAERS